MIQDIIQNYTPYLCNGKSLYSKEDIFKMFEEVKKQLDKADIPVSSVEQYSEATC